MRRRGDDGAGLISVTFGFLVFLTALLFAVHLMVLLYVQAVAADAALVGAHKLAGEGVAAAGLPACQADAQAQAQRVLGRAYDASWVEPAGTSCVDAQGYVTFTVRTKPYRLAGGDLLSGQPVVRSARVRVEQLQ